MTTRYYLVCPRGFRNEVVYFAVPADKAAEADAYFANYSDDNPSGYARWTSDVPAPGVAVAWEDRAYIGY